MRPWLDMPGRATDALAGRSRSGRSAVGWLDDAGAGGVVDPSTKLEPSVPKARRSRQSSRLKITMGRCDGARCLTARSPFRAPTVPWAIDVYATLGLMASLRLPRAQWAADRPLPTEIAANGRFEMVRLEHAPTGRQLECEFMSEEDGLFFS